MSPDDPRHGTNGGYLQHIADRETSCQPCRDAHATARRNLWRKKYVRGVDRLYIESTGSIRRIRALMALGWRYCDIDEAAGYASPRATWAHNITNQQQVHIDTAEKIADVYDRLCMTVGPSIRVRKLAARRGWAPPLAWDDIDCDAYPCGVEVEEGGIDPVVVARLLAGDRIDSTRAEKVEALRQWMDGGGSQREFCQMHGLKQGRYIERTEDAA